MAAPRHTRGFTLVEVLVALLIMAVIAAMGWQGVSGMARAHAIGTAASERTLRISAVIGQWEQDLAAIYDSDRVPGIAFDGASLRLVRRGEDGVQVVVWAVRDGVWQRWAGPVTRRHGDLQQSWLASQQLQGAEREQLRVMDGVTGWQIYFWRGQGWSNAQSSGDVVAVPDEAAAAPPPSDGNNNPKPDANAPNGGANAPKGEANAPTGGANAPRAGANAPGGGGNAPPPAAPRRNRSLLPEGVRLEIDLAEGRLQRDVMLSPSP